MAEREGVEEAAEREEEEARERRAPLPLLPPRARRHQRDKARDGGVPLRSEPPRRELAPLGVDADRPEDPGAGRPFGEGLEAAAELPREERERERRRGGGGGGGGRGLSGPEAGAGVDGALLARARLALPLLPPLLLVLLLAADPHRHEAREPPPALELAAHAGLNPQDAVEPEERDEELGSAWKKRRAVHLRQMPPVLLRRPPDHKIGSARGGRIGSRGGGGGDPAAGEEEVERTGRSGSLTRTWNLSLPAIDRRQRQSVSPVSASPLGQRADERPRRRGSRGP